MLKPLKNRRNFVLIGTALLVVFLLSYYFFTYVPARKQQMNQRGIRAISRLDKNLHERIDHYKYTVSQFDCDYYMMNLDLIESQIGKRIYFKVFSCSEGDDKLVEIDGLKISHDSLATVLRKSLSGKIRAFRKASKETRDSVIEYRAIHQIVINDNDEYESDSRRGFEKLLDLFYEDNKNNLLVLRNRLEKRISKSLDRSIVAYADTIDPADAITVGKFGSKWTGTYAFLGISYEDILSKIKNDALFVDVILSVPDTSRVLNQNQLNLKYFNYIPSDENETNVLEALTNGSEADKEPTDSESNNSPVHIENVDITRKTISGVDFICFTRFVEVEGKPFYLTGLVRYDDYDTNVKKISVWGVMVFVLLTLFFVLILPIAKPFLLSKKERLRSADLMWSAMALVFGISILSMLIIGVDTFIIEEKALVKHKLQHHADSLETQFQSELEQSILASKKSEKFQVNSDVANTSSSFFSVADSLEELFKTLVYLRGDIEMDDSLKHKKLSVQSALGQFINEEAVFIKALKLEFINIEPSGKSGLYDIQVEGNSVDTLRNVFNRLEKSFYNPESTVLLSRYHQYQNALNSTYLTLHQIKADLDLSHRMYYKLMRDREPTNAWNFTLSDGTRTPFYIESLFSLSSGKYSTVTVTKGEYAYDPDCPNISYATDYEWESLNNRYLEPGYTFAVIDKQGTIHFHSDQRKIKNQNFIEETDFNSILSSFLHNRSEQSLGLRFSMKDHQAFVKPLANTPWYVVIMYDIRKSRLNVTQSIITTFQVLIMILLYMLLLHLVLNTERTTMKHGRKNAFSYLFLSPINVSTRVLKVLSVFNLGQIVALIIVYAFNSINLLANITIFFSMITAGLLINYVVLTKYSLVSRDSDGVDDHNKISGFEWVLLTFWGLWFALTFVVSGGEGYAFFIQLIELGIIVYYFNLKRNSPGMEFFLSESAKRPFLSKTMGGYLPFYMHSFSWIVLVGVVSTFLFFKPIYNMQHIKRGLNNWVEEFEAKNSSDFVMQPDHKLNLFTSGDKYSEEIDVDLLQRSSTFLDFISLYFDEDEASFIGQGTSIDDILVWRRYDAKKSTPYFEVKPARDTYRQKLIVPEANTMIAFDLPSIDHSEDIGLAIIFWLAIVLFLNIVFFTVEALGKKFFYLDLLKRLKAVSEEVDNKQASLTQLSISGFSGNNANLMLVGPPYSGRNTIAKSLIHKSQECKYLDFFNKLNEEAKKIDLEFIRNPIIINNFDYRNLDYKLNDTKLDLLEKIIRMRNEHQVSAPLILVSSFSTNQIIAFYKNRVKELMKKSPDNKEEIDSLTSSVYRWESILFGFTTYIVKLSHHPSSDFIENELSFGSTLIYLMPQIKEFEEKLMQQKGGLSDEELEEKIVEAITDMAQNYYSAIWNACSQEEKFLLYDMSQDGLVNPKNERMLSILVRKGLLLTSPALRIFNRSFALFVVENISEEDGAQMEREAKKDGIWMTYRYLVIFLVVVMIVFLAFVEKEVINKMTGIITAGGILLPRIVSFFSSLGNLKLFGKKA